MMARDPEHYKRTMDSFNESMDELYKTSLNIFSELQKTSSRWLIASFLALNSGGIVTSTAQRGDLKAPFLVGFVFFLGVVSALLCALWATFSAGSYIKAVQSASEHAKSLSIESDPQEFLYVSEKIPSSGSALIGPVLLGLSSGVIFIVGTAAFVLQQKPKDSANERRCLAIQRDMLSARPRRADGPDLFQALGCRPQGEGGVYAPPARATRSLS